MAKLLRGLLSFSTVFLLATCSGPSTEPVRITFQLRPPAGRGVLPYAADYPCFGLVVTGEGIPSLQPGTGNRFPADHCPYAGASSTFVPLKTVNGSSVAQVEALVPAGKNRLIQIVALEYSSATACPAGRVSDFIKATNENTAPAGYGGMYEVGYKVADLFVDTQIEVPRIYDSATAKDLRGCLPPATGIQLVPRGPLKVRTGSYSYFQASGGRAPYVYSVSGSGSINSSTGVHSAYSGAGVTDTITVTDADDRTATTSLTTFSPAATPKAWFAADSFGNTAGVNLSTWSNLASGGGLTAYGTPELLPSAVNGYPAVRIPAGVTYARYTGGATFAGTHFVVVARISSTFNGGIFCIGPSGSCTSSYFKMLGSSGAIQGSARKNAEASDTGFLWLGSGFFVAELTGDLSDTMSAGIQLIAAGGVQNGGTSTSALTLTLDSSSKFFLGAPSDGTLDVAEVVVDYASGALGSRTPTVDYLKAKYQLP